MIPKLGLDAPIVEASWHLESVEGQMVGAWDTDPVAVGHHRGTAPLGGRGNCVLSGHSRQAEHGVFSRLDELQVGDAISVVSAGGEHRYVVQSLTKLPELGASLAQRRANAEVMAPAEDTRLTLITCWPDWAYTHRLVIVARPVG